MVPEFKRWIFYQLNEGNEETPWVRPIYNQSFQQYPEVHKEKKTGKAQHRSPRQTRIFTATAQ